MDIRLVGPDAGVSPLLLRVQGFYIYLTSKGGELFNRVSDRLPLYDRRPKKDRHVGHGVTFFDRVSKAVPFRWV